MMPTAEYVIVGGGLAGATAARTLREEGFDGRIALVAGEAHEPYQRPPLSKKFLIELDESEVWAADGGWWRDNDVELRLGDAVARLDVDTRSLRTADGTGMSYDGLVLATGAAARGLGVPGSELAGVHLLRTLDDSRALHDALAGGGRRVVVIGSGWIGMEAAAAARTLGNEVTVLSRGRVPLSSALGDEMGDVFARLHLDNGVKLVRGATVRSIRESTGSVAAVDYELTDGSGAEVEADLVVVGVGASPQTALAEEAGLAIENGIAVDAGMRTSAPRVVAAGDVADPWHPVVGDRLRSEHWANAIGTGRAAALSLLGRDEVYDEIPYFYSDQFELGMEFSGYAPWMSHTHLVIRGDLIGREFVAFWVTTESQVVAGMNVNVWDVNQQVQRLIRSEAPVDEARLADADVALDELVTEA
jgi:3-phenylpropionate/trans-cinnamate dioxygenase ferredoxin reductase subunit